MLQLTKHYSILQLLKRSLYYPKISFQIYQYTIFFNYTHIYI